MGGAGEEGDQARAARIFCFLLTLLVVAGALFATRPFTSQVIRPGYLGLMLLFFLVMGLGEPALRSQGWRCLLLGLGLLFLGALGGALLESGALPSFPAAASMAWLLSEGAGFLLGFSVLSFGFLLWVPEIVHSHRFLQAGLAAVRQEQEKTAALLRRSRRALERAHDELLQAERIAAVGELAAGIAHDLRNPLAIIRSAAQSCAAGPAGGEETARACQVIQRGVDRADRTIRALLELGKPAAFRPRELPGGEVVGEVAALAAVEARKLGVALVEAVPTGAALWGDEGLLVQALLNLVLNALQASPPGGTVRVGFRSFRLGGRRHAALAVEDRGRGIPADIRNRVFTPFFTTRAGGTGLGLPVAQRVAARHGGRLALCPRGRGGTRALLLLPAAIPVEAAP